MSVVFSVLIYLSAGLGVVLWLVGQGRLAQGPVVRVAALIFWPAYLPICLAPRGAPGEPSLQGLGELLERLPLDEGRKREYRQAVERLGRALHARQQELGRLEQAEQRLRALRGSFGDSGRPLLDAEGARVQAAKAGVERELAAAREGVLRLVLRLEVLDLQGSRSDLEAQLSSLEEDIGRLLEAREEAEVLLSARAPAPPAQDPSGAAPLAPPLRGARARSE